MKETKQEQPADEPVQPLSSEQAAEIAGGDGSCTTIGPISGQGSPTDLYDALVDATSHAIERIVKSL